ncbi:NEDD8-specific protease 1-like [Apium graveolens]|uniref:NEDD8-specific protease 1-like n=1 Tax=Apium graveolens TaxID=4045 RepID=UPI003D7BD2D4
MESNYRDIVLTDLEVDTLKGPCYLSDQIIAFYFAYLSGSFNTKKTDTLLVPPFISLLIANSEDTTCVEDYVKSWEMSSERLVLFVVNDIIEDCSGGDGGNHWSILVYDRTKNLFLHFDSMMGVNNFSALKLYDALKEFMGPGGESLSPHASSKKQRKKKKNVPYVKRGSKATQPPAIGESEATAVAGLPMFTECETAPQQQNGYDCGLYVLAIARAICQWSSQEHNRTDMISTIEKNVDYSVEMKMRSEVLEIIQEISADN